MKGSMGRNMGRNESAGKKKGNENNVDVRCRSETKGLLSAMQEDMQIWNKINQEN